MTMRRTILFFALVSLFITECARKYNGAEEVLKKSGKNRPELEKVIRYYKDVKDDQKLAAAYFLIANMQNKQGRYGNIVKEYYPIFDRLHASKKDGANEDTINFVANTLWDSTEQQAGKITKDNYPFFYDYNVITADYLIESIDMAFKAWREKPWARHIAFDQFCEFILPYRVFDEPLESCRKKIYEEFAWLEDSLKEKSDPLEACIFLNKHLAKDFVFSNKLDRCPLVGIADLRKLNAGTCTHRYDIVVSVMRSVGLPISVDFTPQWNRWAGGHSWLAIIDKTGKKRFFNGGEPQISFPESLYVPMANGLTTKVYRKTFAQQRDSLSIKGSEDDIPDFFMKSNCIDVTQEYDFPQTTVKFKLFVPPPKGTQFAFLCCFGYSSKIVPLAYAKISNDSVEFNHVGMEAFYFPAYYKNGNYTIANGPVFYPAHGKVQYPAKTDGKPAFVVHGKSKSVAVKLVRKFGGGGGVTFDYAQWAIGSKFQASDTKEFNNPVTLFTLDSLYYHFLRKNVTSDKPFRYYRFISSDTGKIRVAEVEFLAPGVRRNIDKSKMFKVYGFAERDSTTFSPNFKNAFDGDISTDFNALPGGWAAIDYGKPVKILGIRYLLRNDLNIIEIGDQYELFYFDYGWQSLGKKIAEDNFIIFDKVPDRSLLLLKDLTKGQEERIFMMLNGEQLWF